MMVTPARRRLAAVAAVLAAAGAGVVGCSAGDDRVDPGDLELRDLLGISPDTAIAWDAPARAAARRVLALGLRGADTARRAGDPVGATDLDDRIAAALATSDAERAAEGAVALGVVRVVARVDGFEITAPVAMSAAAELDPSPNARGLGVAPTASMATPWLAEPWDHNPAWADLPGRGLTLLAALAADAGQHDGPVLVVPAPRLAVITAYVASSPGADMPRLLVNPVLLAALEPDRADPAAIAPVSHAVESAAATSPGSGGPRPLPTPAGLANGVGNPYSFYGSVAECAAALRTRCAACLTGATCAPITNTSDAGVECEMFDADDGRGYFLMCINLALAITSVDRCTGAAAPTCARDSGAADSLATLETNATFLAEPVCAGALDGCLAEIYGAPDPPFPGPDGGPAPTEPRSTEVSCSNACDSNDNHCDASPSCSSSGPSCNNSLSCDSECSSSNSQSGCGGNCDACTSSGGGASCSKDSSTSGSSCGSSGGGSSSGGGCSSGSGGGGGCGSSSGGGGGCGGGSGGGGCSSGGGGGGGGTKCSVAAGDPIPGLGFAMSAVWGLLPVPFAAFARRRARRRLTAPHIGDSSDTP